MTFWIIAVAIALAVSAVLAQALRSERDAAPASDYDIKVYRDQLAEIDRDLARGTLLAEDAERARTEISRRILTADAAQAAQSPAATQGRSVVLAAGMALVLVAGSFAMYQQLGAPGYGDLGLKSRIELAAERRADRPAQAAAVAAMPPAQQADAPPEYLALITQLRTTVKQRPDDLKGLELLVNAEARLGNFSAAAAAQADVVRLKGDTADVADFSTLADLHILAAGGYVSPEAETALRAALRIDAGDGTSQYYWGLMLAQTGRPDTTFRIWDALLRRGPPDAPWIGPIQAQIMDIAQLAGVNYEMPSPGAGAQSAPGPSEADIAAASDMSPAERMEMIQGMVSNLSDRLATEGGPASDWARLIMALGVLGERDRAFAILDEARRVFSDDTAALDTLMRAAEQANLE